MEIHGNSNQWSQILPIDLLDLGTFSRLSQSVLSNVACETEQSMVDVLILLEFSHNISQQIHKLVQIFLLKLNGLYFFVNKEQWVKNTVIIEWS